MRSQRICNLVSSARALKNRASCLININITARDGAGMGQIKKTYRDYGKIDRFGAVFSLPCLSLYSKRPGRANIFDQSDECHGKKAGRKEKKTHTARNALAWQV
jgi:hypothetical protein